MYIRDPHGGLKSCNCMTFLIPSKVTGVKNCALIFQKRYLEVPEYFYVPCLVELIGCINLETLPGEDYLSYILLLLSPPANNLQNFNGDQKSTRLFMNLDLEQVFFLTY